jgi:exodeoxyribonuclease VII small subunit
MPNFEEQLTALESVVEKLERGELSLEESVRLFEEGVKLSDACKKELEAAEGKIQILVDRGNGSMKAVPFDVDEEVEDAEDTEDTEDGE